FARVRARGDQLLHARQGRDITLAGPGDLEGRPGLPADALKSADLSESRVGPRRAAVEGTPRSGNRHARRSRLLKKSHTLGTPVLARTSMRTSRPRETCPGQSPPCPSET